MKTINITALSKADTCGFCGAPDAMRMRTETVYVKTIKGPRTLHHKRPICPRCMAEHAPATDNTGLSQASVAALQGDGHASV